jgi:hypothetical protein
MPVSFDEILNKRDKIILGTLVLFIFSLMTILKYSGYFNNEIKNSILNEKFEGKIVSRNTDYKNHGDTKVKLSSGKEIYDYFPKQNVELKIGDSLVKRKNSIYMLVFRNGKYLYEVDLLNI